MGQIDQVKLAEYCPFLNTLSQIIVNPGFTFYINDSVED